MCVEPPPAPAEIVEARLAVRSANEPVLWALPETGELVRAPPAIGWKKTFLIGPEFHLTRRKRHVNERLFHEVAQTVFRIDVVVTGKNISVVFHRQAFAAKFRLGNEFIILGIMMWGR